MKTVTRKEIDDLKRSWANDPCFDLPIGHPAYEEYADELTAFQAETEARWEVSRIRRHTNTCERYHIPFDEVHARIIEMLESKIEDLEKRLKWVQYQE